MSTPSKKGGGAWHTRACAISRQTRRESRRGQHGECGPLLQ
ncbi:hypothetical protein D187_007409 [Cystobacter fuscus DSM 2262]|uniref:Uncharacterized protein n=1 Tax=Cystobacter fuscus (strain ATCC 25194 / DSM 2262 / NBRC 100088 / M29) TaxID=1242864 RepID=S9P1C8_CYSF2|nr:hypothetical protein D187_007409 [Cystobacter fuscus DSM 2262]